ncbi:MAG TPA: hypothetical protein VHH36_07010 [Candidatus Thermoplasmatota archaeon]|nr:hypothetical protein [Candidatus Thermoplasmatota archaeon]
MRLVAILIAATFLAVAAPADAAAKPKCLATFSSFDYIVPAAMKGGSTWFVFKENKTGHYMFYKDADGDGKLRRYDEHKDDTCRLTAALPDELSEMQL